MSLTYATFFRYISAGKNRMLRFVHSQLASLNWLTNVEMRLMTTQYTS